MPSQREPILSHVSIPVAVTPPSGFARVEWPGRMGPIAAVIGESETECGRALLVPGLTGSKEDYFAILGPLRDCGWSVAAVDLPGMYQSAGTDEEADYRLELLAGDVVAMVRYWGRGQRVHLVGHSVGGLVARHAALLALDSLASLTLYASGCGSLSAAATANAQMLREALRHASPEQVHAMKAELDRQRGRPDPAPEVAALLAQRWRGTTAAHLRAMALIGLSAPDLVEELAALSGSGGLPILVLYGEDDDETWNLESFAELAARVATSTVVVPGAAHSPAVENPAAMADALSHFWSLSADRGLTPPALG